MPQRVRNRIIFLLERPILRGAGLLLHPARTRVWTFRPADDVIVLVTYA